MNLSEIVERVADESNVTSEVASVSTRIKNEINRACQEEWEGHRWSFRWRNYRIVTDTNVTSGTLTATNGSRTITGAGTSFSSNYVGWYITFNGDSVQNIYKIRAFTSSTQLELDVPYQGTTGSGKLYILTKLDYILPTEPWDIDSVNITYKGTPLTCVETSGIDMLSPVPISTGDPEYYSIYGSDSVATVYSTGTITGTIDTNTVSGSGTAWLSNVSPGDILKVGSYSYRVRSVNSDTSITLYNSQQITSTSASYTITRQFGRILRIMWPSTYNYTLDLRALRNYSPLINNNDTNELLYRYPNAVILKASAIELKRQNDVRSKLLMDEASIAWAKAKADDDSLTKKEPVAPIFTYRM